MENTFLTIEEAADLLRISPRSAYTLAREGRLAGAVKVGNQWRVSHAVLMNWATATAEVNGEKSVESKKR